VTCSRLLLVVALWLGAIAGGGAVNVFAQPTKSRQILVVVSAANPVESLDLARVRRIFLREQTVWANGWPISAFERSSGQPIRAEFSSTVLGKDPGQLTEYWLNFQMTRGLDPPRVCRTVLLMTEYFERLKGGIGYVYEDELADGMKVVARVRVKGPRQ
jgi:ABC-type phosphate transport system substrate-binding protein